MVLLAYFYSEEQSPFSKLRHQNKKYEKGNLFDSFRKYCVFLFCDQNKQEQYKPSFKTWSSTFLQI